VPLHEDTIGIAVARKSALDGECVTDGSEFSLIHALNHSHD
jgi:hypothetical protein